MSALQPPTPAPRAPRRRLAASLALAAVALAAALPAHAYVGPGAGFALLGSFAVIFVTLILALVSLLIWPFRTLWRKLRRGKAPSPKIRRLIFLGLDGQDPQLTDRFMAEGKLPSFERLAEMGCYRRLRTTYPAVSPVAWSSFSTGTHPAKHNIFDFLDRDLKTYLPKLSSTYIGGVDRYLKLGRWKIPLGKPELRLLRRSKPFWTLLGEKGIWSTVLRVPITFPPDRFYGAELAAMSVPDLLGTQGTFLLFSTRPPGDRFKEGGERFALEAVDGPGGDRFEAVLQGPENSFRQGDPPLAIPLALTLDRAQARARVELDGTPHELVAGRLSDWIELAFKAAPGIKVSGLCRMMVTEMGEHVSLYVTPINIDPERPAMPISHPSYYATYLAKKIGPFATLGLAEDTWSLNEGVVDDDTFLEAAWDIDSERRAMFFAALDRLRRGSLTCVFDGTDRIQHMFWRYLEKDHPARAAIAGNGARPDAIEELYRRNDELVGQVMARLGKGDVLVVLSDHGFASFRRGVNVNRWLLDHGYLALKEGTDGSAEWLRDVDWSRTRAYCLGLTGMFLNLRGREAQGIVEPADAPALKRELITALSGLRDPASGEVGITEIFDTRELYSGPYLANAPDFVVGYNRGYRVSWDCATGVVAEEVFTDNTKAWSGDHGIDPRLVPGVLFASHDLDVDDPALWDLAPTALALFGVEPPHHMDGKVLITRERLEENPFRIAADAAERKKAARERNVA